MWISKKKFKQLEKRIADLEGQVQSQQKCNAEYTKLMTKKGSICSNQSQCV